LLRRRLQQPLRRMRSIAGGQRQRDVLSSAGRLSGQPALRGRARLQWQRGGVPHRCLHLRRVLLRGDLLRRQRCLPAAEATRRCVQLGDGRRLQNSRL
jgi:hypothetical protein